ncbi:hypothetical protein QVD99_002668 [Batrachochytrium dendrobatidis]|nr:hypothetical protein QVD99_002668 [Batrachochytrium dendrobatidis]
MATLLSASASPSTTHSVPIQPPELKPRWFRAIDIPIRDDTPFKYQPVGYVAKPASQWEPLSMHDSNAIEGIYQKLVKKSIGGTRNMNGLSPVRQKERITPKKDNCIIGGEDNLYEIDVENLEIYPVFWSGPTYEIRRGTWFAPTGAGSSYQPCDENLSRQLEDGYRKYIPWVPAGASNIPTVPTSLSSTEDASILSNKPETQRWALFGPYMNQYVVYASSTSAWLQSDMLTSKLTRAVTNSSGMKLVRSWSEVCKLTAKSRLANTARTIRRGSKADLNQQAPATSTDGKSIPDLVPTKASEQIPTEEDLEEETYTERQVDHLVFVIHGIGQKLSERVDAVNFPHDCDILRKAIKASAKQFHDQIAVLKNQDPKIIPAGSGVQVLPIQWRQNIDFSMRKPEGETPGDEAELTLDDITLDGIPSIRMLVSDVIIDVLMYLTPKYRQEMIRQVTTELNRVYHKYLERNPTFSGKISLYGHSLGSILAYDIMSHQHMSRPLDGKDDKAPKHEVDLSDLLAKTVQNGRISGLIESVDTLEYEPLDFRVNALFALGSPIGVFLLLRGNHIGAFEGAETSLADPRCSRPDVKSLYNIFHPYDPVAHRIEPLVIKSMSYLKPVSIPYTKGGITETIYGIQDLGTGIVERGRNIIESVRMGLFTRFSTTAEMVNQAGRAINMVGFSPSASQSQMVEVPVPVTTGTAHVPDAGSLAQQSQPIRDNANPLSLDEKPSQKFEMTTPQRASNTNLKGAALSASERTTALSPQRIAERVSNATKAAAQNADLRLLNPSGRLDYTLQEGVLENPYLSSLGVHMSYWDDTDCSMFILKELYGIPSIPIPRTNPSESASVAPTETK